MSSLGTTIEAAYVVDTHALIWYLRGSDLLSATAYAIFRAAERGGTRLCISSISVAEMYYANRKYGWFPDFDAMYKSLKQKPYIRLVSFSADDVLDFDTDERVPEMHDRIIAGLSRRLAAPLITSDSTIRAVHVGTIIW